VGAWGLAYNSGTDIKLEGHDRLLGLVSVHDCSKMSEDEPGRPARSRAIGRIPGRRMKHNVC
jgi:hypothetical protein